MSEIKLDRRKAVNMREYLVPVITSLIVGFGSSYLAIYVAINKMTLQIEYIERDLGNIQEIKENINDNKYKTQLVEIWIADYGKRLEKIENVIYSKGD